MQNGALHGVQLFCPLQAFIADVRLFGQHAKARAGHVAQHGVRLFQRGVYILAVYEAAGTDFAALAMDMKEKLEDSLGDMLEAARNNPDIPSVGVVVKAGRITETLNEELIQPFDPDLVICGERGLSNIKYVFVGSVSTYLIRNVRCDVLVVKED